MLTLGQRSTQASREIYKVMLTHKKEKVLLESCRTFCYLFLRIIFN